MRYYEIALSQPGAATPSVVFSSHPNGMYDPRALNVILDMPITAYDTPVGGQTLTIEGIPLAQISQAQKLQKMLITVKGGMQQGLPLANPSQAGVLAKGEIFQSWGNWEGAEMNLNILLQPSSYTMQQPGNFMFCWKAGQSLPDALTSMFSIVYPGMPVSINVGLNIVNDYDFFHRASTLEGFASVLRDFTDSQFDQPVFHTIQAGKMMVFDSTYQPSPTQIQFTDLIGQPTWIGQQLMQMKTVMRGDLQVGSIITMPQGFKNAPGFIATQGSSLPSSNKYQSAFQNNFQITEIRHVGEYRSPDGSAWSSIFNCLSLAPT